MRPGFRCAFLIIFSLSLLWAAEGYSQQRPEREQHHEKGIFSEIDRHYERGRISLEERLLYKIKAVREPGRLPSSYRIHLGSPIKCGTPASSDYHRYRDRLSSDAARKIGDMLKTPALQTSETYESPSGNFLIHYETDGTHAVPPEDANGNNIPDYVEEAAIAADSSYNHQVHTLGYRDPIPAGERYSIEILNLQFYYGETYVVSGNTTRIRVENDFSESFPPNDDPDGDQLGALRATIAHEFKHAVQFVNNSWIGETGNWLEMDATLMEEVVYDDVNDYYNYLENDESIFSDPEQSFYPGSYYHVSWALYFQEKFGPRFWVNIWEIIDDNPAITMVDAITQRLGGVENFNREYIESQLWHFAAGSENTVPGFGFEEAAAYPSPPVDTEGGLLDRHFIIPRSNNSPMPEGFAAKYYEVPLPETVEGNISLELAAEESHHGVGLIAYYRNGSVGTTAFPASPGEPSFRTSTLQWDNIDRLGLVLTNSSTSEDTGGNSVYVGVGDSSFSNTLSQNYPNPFNTTTKIRFTLEESSRVRLLIYNSAGQLVRRLLNEELPAGLHEPVFDGSNLASGVYFYRLSANGRQTVKQMTLIK